MSTVAHFSLAEYEHMAALGAFDGEFHRRVELIRGEILDMSPIGTEHAYFVDLLARWSHQTAPRDQVIIRTQNPLRIPALESEPEPDVVWVRLANYSRRHPDPADVLLLIEVADSSLAHDRGAKLALYAEAGVQEYWIVNLLDEQIEVHRNPSGRDYQHRSLHRDDAAVSPLLFPALDLRPAKLFAV